MPEDVHAGFVRKTVGWPCTLFVVFVKVQRAAQKAQQCSDDWRDYCKKNGLPPCENHFPILGSSPARPFVV